MSRRYVQYSDLKKRSIVFEREQLSRQLHCIYNEHLLYSGNKDVDALHQPTFHFAHYLSFKRSSISMYRSKVRNRCAYSGSARAVFSAYRLSRFFFKMLARNGQLNGITKSSW